MLRLDVADVPIAAACSAALDARANVQSLIGTLVKWEWRQLSACAAPDLCLRTEPRALTRSAKPPCSISISGRGVRSQPALRDLAFKRCGRQVLSSGKS